ncbi:serine/threonine protein kinase, partial [Streptomyces sp. URMC 126]
PASPTTPAPAAVAPEPARSATPPGTPAATPPAAFAPPPGPPGGPRRTVRVRTAVLAGVALVTLAGLGAGAAAWLVLRDDGERDDARGPVTSRSVVARPPAARPSDASGRPAPQRPADGPSASGPAAGTPEASPPADSPAPSASPDADKAPSGYHVVRDPAGFTLAVPDGYTRSFEPPRVFYYSPDKEFRIGVLVSDPKEGGPIGFMRDSASQAPDRYPGYRDGRVARTTHNGNQAASWEFTWNGFEDTSGPRRTEDVCWNEGGRMYDVWVSAPAARAAEGRRHFDTVLGSFARSG